MTMKLRTKLILETAFKLPLVIFGIVMIVFGSLNIEQDGVPNGCMSADRLPVFILVGGVLVILCIALRTILERVCDSCSMFTQDQDCCKVGGKILQFTFLVIYDCVLVTLATAWSLVGLIYVLNNVPKSSFYKIEQSLGGVGEDIKKGFENLSGQEPAEEDKVFDCNIHVYNISIVSIFVGFVVAVLTLVFLVFGRLCCDLCCCGPCAKEKDNVSIHSQKHREVKDPDDRLATRVA